MTHNILLTKFQVGKCLLTRDGVPKDPYRRCHGPAEGRMTPTLPPFLRPGSLHSPTFCYAIQAFPIASDFDPKQMPKIQNKITMRKVCIVIQSLVSRRPDHHSGDSQDREKHNTLFTLKRRKKVVYDVTNVEQHEQFGFDASRPLPDVIPKRANSLAVVEGVLSRFFQTTAVASTIGHVCQARLVVQAEKG